MRIFILALVPVIALLQPAYATIIHVPEDQPTIQTGIDASGEGDTVLVAPGTYQEHLDFGGRVLSLISVFGTDLTIIDGSGANGSTITISGLPAMADSARLVGFTIRGGGNAHTIDIINNSSAVSIRNNVFHSNIVGISNNRSVIRAASAARIEQNLFYDNGGVNCVVSDTDVRIINNTMDSNGRGIYSHSSQTVAMNNIVTNSVEYGIDGTYGLNDYNDAWNNGSANTPGSHGISVDPQFVFPAVADYSLANNSPCIDAGNPDPIYADPDGTIADMGAYYFDQGGLNIWQISLGPENLSHVINNTPTIYWRFADTSTTQVSYEIEVGTDPDWTVAEMWATGEVTSSDTSAFYEGAPLEDGNTYSVRVRVSDGTDWSYWKSTVFHMNAAPTAPLPLSPAPGGTSPAVYTRLYVQNSEDADNDNLRYEFMVSSSPDTLDIIYTESDVAEGADSTGTAAIPGLFQGNIYWWRARSSDGFENSPWTDLTPFTAVNIQTIRVPEDQPTIQAAIDAADPLARIVVDPGEYHENISYSGKFLIITGAGPGLSFLTPASTAYPAVTIMQGEISITEFSGFTVSGASDNSLFRVGNDAAPLITNCVFRNYRRTGTKDANSDDVVIRVTSDATITHNLFYNNGGISCIGISDGGRADIINNTFDNNARGFHTVTGRGRALNNIVTNSSEYGIFGDFESLDYNCVWENNPDYLYVPAPGDHDIQADPQYISPDLFDYELRVGSPCIDAGDPSPEFNDSDGTRNDIGAYPFDYLSLPRAVRINLGADEDMYHVVSDAPTIYWGCLDVTADQEAYTIEIGTDLDWTVAEQWNSGEVTTSDTSAVYDGAPLVDGATYYGRIRLFNGIQWGRWSEFVFKMNIPPDVPVLFSPSNGGSLSDSRMRLGVYASENPDNDTMKYDFEVFYDPGLSQPVAYQYGIAGQPTLSWSDVLYNVENGVTYWWRARADDGHEVSAWSQLWSFTFNWGGVIHVPADYPTIQAAVTAAVNGKVIMVAAGDYAESIDFGSKQVKVIGEGPDITFLTPKWPDSAAVYFRNGESPFAEISGFTIQGGEGNQLIYVGNGAEPVIRNNVFRDFAVNKSQNVVIRVTSDALIVGNVFYDNGGISCIGISDGGTAHIISNTFDRNNRGLNSITGRGVALNNIISNSNGYGIYGKFEDLDYNCVWNNNPDYTHDAVGGEHSVNSMPAYVSEIDRIYLLFPFSPCVDAGKPLPQYNDSDGSFCDLGAYPLDALTPPIAINIDWCGQDPTHIVYHMCDINWEYLGLQILGQQSAYEIEVGTDNDWTEAEMWSSGQVVSSITKALYLGEYLENGERYYLRIRVNDGSNWGDWRTFSFRMNTEPEIPIQAWPPGGEALDPLDVHLSVANSSDAEGDTLTYGFEVYNTRDVNDIAASCEGIPQQDIFTTSGLIPGLESGHYYWWRARANDGYEYSRWTPFDSFVTTGATIIKVPENLPSIQAAINVAGDGNVIMVGPGQYTENINFRGKQVRVRSTGGPDATTLMPQNTGLPLVAFDSTEGSGAELSGFTMTGTLDWPGTSISLVRISSNASPLITGNIFRDFTVLNNRAYSAVLSATNSGAIIKRNLFHHNGGDECIRVDGGSSIIENNTLEANRVGIVFTGGDAVIKNNIITNSSSFGIQATTTMSSCDYNCVWQNRINYYQYASPGEHDISVDPMYTDTTSFNYRLLSSSPCIDAGDPATFVPYYGGDAIDMGAFEAYQWPAGDATADGEVNIADAIYIVNYIFKGGPAPDQPAFADCNADCEVNIADAVYLITYIFKNGPPPEMGCVYLYEMNEDSTIVEDR